MPLQSMGNGFCQFREVKFILFVFITPQRVLKSKFDDV